MEILSNRDLFYEEKIYEQFNIHSDSSLFCRFYSILIDLNIAPFRMFDTTIEHQLTDIFNHACYISIVSPLILLPENVKMTEIFTPTWGETYAMAYILLRDFHPQRDETRIKRMLDTIRNYNTENPFRQHDAENFGRFIQKYDENPFTGTLPETFITRRVLTADILAAMNFSNITDTYNKEKITELAGYFINMQQRNLLLKHIEAEVSQDSGIADSVKSDTLTLLSSLRLTEEPAPEEPTESSEPTAGSHSLLELQEALSEIERLKTENEELRKQCEELESHIGNRKTLTNTQATIFLTAIGFLEEEAWKARGRRDWKAPGKTTLGTVSQDVFGYSSTTSQKNAKGTIKDTDKEAVKAALNDKFPLLAEWVDKVY